MKYLVSIIIPVYNSEKYIADTIKSIQKQTYKYWELIIIDDSSKDKSISIVKEIIKTESRIKLICLDRNYGTAIARNKGIECSKGSFIAFIDSDDIWHHQKIEKQLSFMLKNDYLFTFTSYKIISADGRVLTDQIINCPKKISYNDLLKTNYIGCLTVIYNAKKLGKIYMPIIRKRQDYICWLNILKNNKYAYYLNKQYASYRIHNESLSNDKLKMCFYQWHIYRKIENLDIYNSIFYLFNYIYYGLKKRKSLYFK